MEGYKSPMAWSYQPNFERGAGQRDYFQKPVGLSYSNNESYNTNSSDNYPRGGHSVSQDPNPLRVDFNELHGTNKFSQVKDSIDRNSRPQRQNYASDPFQQRYPVSQGNINATSEDKYTQLLHQMKPSMDTIERMEPLVRNSCARDRYFDSKPRSQPEIGTRPVKSVLISKPSMRATLSKQKSVGFSDNVDVVEVENWKIYNVDMAKKAKEESRAKNGAICQIF